MAAERYTGRGAIAALLRLAIAALFLVGQPTPAAAQGISSPWRIVAEDGLCAGAYHLGGDLAYGFAWSPSGELAWQIFRANATGKPAPVRMAVLTAIGDAFEGVGEAEQDEDFRVYSLLDNDRRNGRLIFSGDAVFRFEEDGRQTTQVVPFGVQAPRIAACMAQAREQAATAGAPPSLAKGGRQTEPQGPRVVSTGSGVFVDGKGALITNAHVVQGCQAVGSNLLGPGELVAVDAASDLALLRFKRSGGAYARLRESGVRLGEPVVAAGYPLQDVLANGLNVTTGNVSALAGPGGDRRMLQITAPVQPGNSGGALLDSRGALIGVVVSRLEEEAGRPQNVNFAVAPYVVGAFLRENGIAIEGPGGPVKDVASLARQFTFQLECVG